MASASLLAAANSTEKPKLYQSFLDAMASSTDSSYKLLGTRTIGVDFGLVRTGIATSVGYKPKPLAILTDLNNTQVCHQVIKYALAEQASQIIVGLPLHKNGTVAEQTNITLVFAEELTSCVLCALGPTVRVILWDERYTSKEAAARAHAASPDRELYGTLDAEAACIILEHYFNENGQGALSVELDESKRQESLQMYAKKQAEEQLRISQIAYERDARLQRRSEMINRQKAEETKPFDGPDSRRKKKKKKRKR